VLVAHLDTGLDGTHPALQDAVGIFAQFDDLGNIVTLLLLLLIAPSTGHILRQLKPAGNEINRTDSA
jgi:hypothetical protein